MKQKSIELWVGILMLLGILAFIFMAFRVSGLSVTSNPFVSSTYTLKASFTDIGSLKTQSAVDIAGVQIGKVQSITLNPQTYAAQVNFAIDKDIQIPADSSVSITSAGILGDNYVSITPGFAAQNLKNGDQFVTTYPATNLQSLLSTFMSSGASKS